MSVERTLILVKPDGVERGLAGEILARFERRGFTMRAAKLLRVTDDLAGRHYAEHAEKPFFPELVSFITSGPVVAMIVVGADAVAGVRQIMGATNPLDAVPGSIRGDYATVIAENIVHGSDSVESADREIKLFFG